MIAELAALGGAAVVLSALLTAWVRRVALARGILDSPNERSSHVRPTPRGGGIAIVVTSLAAMIALVWCDRMDAHLFYALAGGGTAVAFVGHLDDRGRIGIVGRFTVHIAAAIWAVAWVGVKIEVHWGEHLITFSYLGPLLAVLGIVWALNLFNFMDGIDGIAASQAVFMAGGGAVFALLAGLSSATPAACLAIAAGCLGFLYWNWPPARIFMGDVGSGYLGYALAVVGLAAMRERAEMLPVWVILSGVFLTDSTGTLLRRLVRRERIYEAHRSHAYQWQARRWNSHLRVTLACTLLNLFWLAPWAWFSIRQPESAGWAVVGALAPLTLLTLVSGAGRREI